MFWSNAAEFCLLYSNYRMYAPYVKSYALRIQHLIFLNYKIMSISSLSSCSTAQHTITIHLPIVIYVHLYEHFEFIFVLLHL